MPESQQMSREQLKRLAVARKRPTAEMLGKLEPNSIRTLLDYFWQHQDENILATASRERAERGLGNENDAYFNGNYAQVELQRSSGNTDQPSRMSYISSNSPEVTQKIEELIGPFYRARLSALKPGGVIPKHLDDPGDNRVLCILYGKQEFLIWDKEKRELEMGLGELWFVNTTWEHQVTNPTNSVRVALLLNMFEYPNTKNV